jgi:hypothetical protein
MYIGGFILRLADIMGFSIIILFFICKRYNVAQIYSPVGFFFLSLFFLYCFLNTLWHAGLTKAVVATFQWTMIWVILIIAYSHSVMKKEEFIKIFFRTLFIICASVVIYHFYHGQFFRYKLLGDAKYIFGLTGVLVLSHFFFFRDRKYLLGLFILYPFLLFSLERKGILAFHIVLFIYVCYSFRMFLSYSVVIILSILTATIFIYPEIYSFLDLSIFDYTYYEMLSLDEEKALWISNYHRQSLILNGWDIFTQNPIFGVGAKMLTFSMLDYYINPSLALYTHNVFLDTLIEQGIVGLILLLSPYFIFFMATEFKSSQQIICFVALCAYSLIMLMFMAAGSPSIIIFYFPLIFSFVFSYTSDH